ncbi:MAG: hypothetical protein ACI9G5_002976 [Paracoccaceae bacterium]
MLLRDPRSAAHQAATANGENSIASAVPEFKRWLLDSPAQGLAIIGGVAVTFAQGALGLDQVWMVQECVFTTVGAQQLSGTMFLLAGVLGTLLGGVGSDMLESRYKDGRLYFLAFIYLLATPLTLIFRFADPDGVMFHIAIRKSDRRPTCRYANSGVWPSPKLGLRHWRALPDSLRCPASILLRDGLQEAKRMWKVN